MKKLTLIVFLLTVTNLLYSQTLDEGLSSLTTQISSRMTESNKQKIAVIEFSDLDGHITDLGKYLSEELITRLFLTNKFQVIERQLLNKVLAEHKLNASGLIDESTAKELGKILGVEAIVSGTITDLGESVKVNARLISTETGQIFSVASGKMEKDNTIKRLMGIHISGETKTSKKTTDDGDIFFKEDFSEYEVGDIASDWGYNIVVRNAKVGGKLIETQVKNVILEHNINFPKNFAFEFDFWGGWWYPDESMIFIDKDGKELKIVLHAGMRDCIYLNGIKSDNYNSLFLNDGWNEAKVLVKDSTIKIYVNSTYMVSGSFPQYSDFVRIKYTAYSSKRQFKDFVGRILN